MIHVLVVVVLAVVLLVEIQNADHVGAAASCTNPEHQLTHVLLNFGTSASLATAKSQH